MNISTCGQVFEGGTKDMPAETPCNTTVWCRIPMRTEGPDGKLAPTYSVERTDARTTTVKMEGISFLIMEPSVLEQLQNKGADLKAAAHDLLREYGLDNDALGVIYLKNEKPAAEASAAEDSTGYRSIVPTIWVKAIDTTFLENACGSGSIATTLAACAAAPEGPDAYTIMQPSGKPLTVALELDADGTVSAVNFSGPVATDGVMHTLNV
jgi:hypothetical protein